MSGLNPDCGGRGQSRASGLTLIEVLVVTAILGVVTAVLAASFAGGIRLWERARDFGGRSMDVALALDVLESDLVNTFSFRGGGLAGGEAELSFPRLVEADGGVGEEAGAGVRRPGFVRYGLRRGVGLVRQRWVFPGEPSAGGGEALVAGVEAVSFRYAGPAEQGAAGSALGERWSSRWTDATNFPAAVRIELRVGAGEGAERVYARTVRMPLARAERGAGR